MTETVKGLQYFNRRKGRLEREDIYGDRLLRFFYTHRLGRRISPLFTGATLSKAVGLYQNTRWSRREIKRFIHKYGIDMNQFLIQEGQTEKDPYKSFNQFFIRQFKPKQREFSPIPNEFCAFAEGRYLCFPKWPLAGGAKVKGVEVGPNILAPHKKWAKHFEQASVAIARLCPVDYHRFHFPDDGKIVDHYRAKGPLHSVNPLALQHRSNILLTNERQVTIVESSNFGLMAIIEVGAMCVGKIVQTHSLKGQCQRGEEKGLFLFGGSTVVFLGDPHLKWDRDILDNNRRGTEVYLQLGEKMGTME